MRIESCQNISGRSDARTTGLLDRFRPLLNISQEIDSERVARAVLSISMEQSGAAYGKLIQYQEGEPAFAIDALRGESAVLRGDVSVAASNAFIDDALRSAQPRITIDPAEISSLLQEHPERSVPLQIICIPSEADDGMSLVLYLELDTGVENSASIEVVDLVLRQGAISFRHALQFEKITLENRKRIETEEKLLAAQSSLLKAQRIGQMGHFRWNVRTGVSRASDECYRLFGIEPAASIPYRTWADRLHPDDFPIVERELFRAATARTIFQAEYRAIRPEGEIRYLRAEGHPEVLPNGDVEYDGIILDVTDSRLAEQRFLQLQKELAAKMRLSAIGEFAGSIAHEIKQPLAAVVTAAEASLRWLSRDPPEIAEARSALSGLASDGRRAAAVVASIRSLADRHQKAFHLFDLNDAIREVITVEKTEFDQVGASVILELIDRPLTIDGDRLQMQQVVINLIRNALEAMFDLGRGAKAIKIATTQAASGDAHICVTDNGVGFDVVNAERMFEPLFTTKPYGMGMGLSICRTIAEAHEGKIWVTRNLPRGSVFHLQLPTSSRRADESHA